MAIFFDTVENEDLYKTRKNIYNIKEDKKDTEKGDLLGVDLATKNIKRILKDEKSNKGRKRKDLLEYEKILNKGKIIKDLEDAKEIFSSMKNNNELFHKNYLYEKREEAERAKNVVSTLETSDEKNKIRSNANFLSLITVKKQSDEIYEKIIDYVEEINFNIFFSILVINFINSFNTVENCEKNIDKSLDYYNKTNDLKYLGAVLDLIKEANINLNSIFSFKKISKENEMKKFLLNFYYYFQALKIFF